MLIKLLFLITITIITVQNEIPPCRIVSDAVKWTKLQQQYLNQTPNGPFYGEFQASCGIMMECCPDERKNFFDLMHRNKFVDTCIGKRALLPFKSFSTKCKNFIQILDAIKNNRGYTNFISIMLSIPGSLERIQTWRKQIALVCSDDECEAIYCQTENTIKFQSCQEKVLSLVASENNVEDYDAYVRQFENHYNIYTERLSKAFEHF